MILATENVGNRRQMYIISCMNQSNHNLFKRKRNRFYDMHKWLDDVEDAQVILKTSFLIWEMHQKL